ncbi:hypothetical protein LLY41_09655 [Cytobacillus firmus]|uniref:hypothetical protein n=1 Tax=Cytobacillus firmus TaxID=1399 RepID=UPI0021885BD1|nr:hypothetical protein [Cytobacillus firmus]URM34622.1 hypothetical protein LLY41_09655 [Cytobacillus firmus]
MKYELVDELGVPIRSLGCWRLPISNRLAITNGEKRMVNGKKRLGMNKSSVSTFGGSISCILNLASLVFLTN